MKNFTSAKALCLSISLVAGAGAEARPAAELLEKARSLVEAKQYALARVYLEPVVIDPRLTPEARANAYYLRGFAFMVDDLPVSAMQNYRRALEYNGEHAAAMHALAHVVSLDASFANNQAESFVLYEAAARSGHEQSMLSAGYALLLGVGVERDVEKARYWLEAAREAGLTRSITYLAHSYRKPYTEEPEPERAKALYEEAIATGSAEAELGLGFMLMNGELGPPDPARAIDLFKRAADGGSAVANAQLGFAHLEGKGVARDDSAAFERFSAAANAGSADGFRGLGYLYESGRGVTADPAQAEAWYARAATGGDEFSQLQLGFLKLRAGDHTAAARWLAMAAESSNPRAKNDYAWLLATADDDSIRDGERALQFATEAVEQQPIAQYVDTLAAAYAELGDFEQAVSEQERALSLVPDEQEELRNDLLRRLNAYRDARPWRE